MGAAFVAAITPILKVATGVATAVTAVKGITEKGPEAPTVTPTPTITEEKKPITEAPEVAKDIAKEAEKKRRRARTKTLLTGPRGVLTEAPVARKTLLGE